MREAAALARLGNSSVSTPSAVKAGYADGVLTLELPKRASAAASRIQVR